MTGELADTTLRDDLDALGARLRLGEAATGLEPGDLRGGVLRTDRGGYGFERLVLATGATPVALPGAGRQRFLRTLDEALTLRTLLRPGLRLAIVGAGWIGAELATAAAAHGCRGTVLEAAAAPLTAAVGAEGGALTARWYAAAGVELRLRHAVESIEPGGRALAGGGWLAPGAVGGAGSVGSLLAGRGAARGARDRELAAGPGAGPSRDRVGDPGRRGPAQRPSDPGAGRRSRLIAAAVQGPGRRRAAAEGAGGAGLPVAWPLW